MGTPLCDGGDLLRCGCCKGLVPDVLILCNCSWEVLSRRALAMPATMRGPLSLDKIPCRGFLSSDSTALSQWERPHRTTSPSARARLLQCMFSVSYKFQLRDADSLVPDTLQRQGLARMAS